MGLLRGFKNFFLTQTDFCDNIPVSKRFFKKNFVFVGIYPHYGAFYYFITLWAACQEDFFKKLLIFLSFINFLHFSAAKELKTIAALYFIFYGTPGNVYVFLCDIHTPNSKKRCGKIAAPFFKI